MKKKIFGSLAILTIAVIVAFNVNLGTKKSNPTSLLALANVEALADGEVTFPYLCRGEWYFCTFDEVYEEVIWGERIW